jgi:hypothetical protein
MSEYFYYPPRSADYCSGNGGGWTTVFSAIVGGVVGYFAGSRNGCNGNWNGCGNGCNNGGQTVFQQGEYAGEGRAADNFIAQKVNGLENMLVAMNNDAKDQRINDLIARNQALETRQLIVETAGPIACGVNQVNRTLDAAGAGCGFRSYPACGNRCNGF